MAAWRDAAARAARRVRARGRDQAAPQRRRAARRGVAGGVVWIAVVARSARRRRRAQRRRAAAERPARQARRASARAARARTRRSRPSSRARGRRRGSRRRRRERSGSCPPTRPTTTYVELARRRRAGERAARQPADPAPPRGLRRSPSRVTLGARGRGCRSCARPSLEQPGVEPAPRDVVDSRPAAARSSTARASSSRSASRRRPSTPTRGRCATPQRGRGRGRHASSASTPNELYRAARSTGSTSFVYVAAARPTRQGARSSQKRGLAGLDFYPEERRVYPQGTVASQVLGYAGVDNKGLAGLELALDRDARGQAGQARRSSATRSAARSTSSASTPEQRRDATSSSRSTTRSRRTPRRCCAQTVAQWHAKAATAIVLDPRTGGVLAMAQRAGLRREQLRPTSPRDAAAQPRGHRHVRAGLDVQARDRRGRALGRARHAETRVHAAVRRSRSPTASIHDAEPRGDRDDDASRRSSRTRRTSARSRSPSCSARQRLDALDLRASASGSTTGHRLPGREPRDRAAARASGRARRSATSRSARASRSRRSRWRPCTRAVANGGVWVAAAPRRPRRRPAPPRSSQRRRIVSPAVARELMAMLQDVVAERAPGTRGRGPGLPASPARRAPRQKPDAHGGYSDAKLRRLVRRHRAGVAARGSSMLVSVDEPQGAIFGGVVAAPAFAQIAKFDLQYLEVPPDDPSHRASTPSAQPVARCARPPPHGDRIAAGRARLSVVHKSAANATLR